MARVLARFGLPQLLGPKPRDLGGQAGGVTLGVSKLAFDSKGGGPPYSLEVDFTVTDPSQPVGSPLSFQVQFQWHHADGSGPGATTWGTFSTTNGARVYAGTPYGFNDPAGTQFEVGVVIQNLVENGSPRSDIQSISSGWTPLATGGPPVQPQAYQPQQPLPPPNQPPPGGSGWSPGSLIAQLIRSLFGGQGSGG